MRKASQGVPYILAFSQQQQNKTLHNNPQRPNKRNLLVNRLTVSRLLSLIAPVIFTLQLTFPLQPS